MNEEEREPEEEQLYVYEITLACQMTRDQLPSVGKFGEMFGRPAIVLALIEKGPA